MACKAWPESAISHERWGMAQLHRTRVEYKVLLWMVKSSEKCFTQAKVAEKEGQAEKACVQGLRTVLLSEGG